MDHPRLIEEAFPMVQASIDSVHEKNVRHGHISTLHIWPARRPLAACRAALIATLLPDPGTKEERAKLLERIGGRVVHPKESKDKGAEKSVKMETQGGVLHWGRETSPDMDWFRARIREAYGGRAPRVLDPFAGGGAIPLEAMRLGCEVTAADINPVAWFILKCTLEYPQRLAGQKRPLPAFALESPEFMAQFRKVAGAAKRKPMQQELIPSKRPVQGALFDTDPGGIDADLAWHVRAWGWWVLQRARADLARFYPVVDGKLTVAYLWARTVPCKGCRATIPLLKTRWLCKKDNMRMALTMQANADRSGVVFGIWQNVPVEGGNNAQRRARDREIGGGTMSRAGATCPCCSTIMRSEDLRSEAQAGRLSARMTAVVVDGRSGKEYRLPTEEEMQAASDAAQYLPEVFAKVPFGIPNEPIPQGASRGGGGSPFTTYLYGLDQWGKLFTPRQLLALGTFVTHTRSAREAMRGTEGYPTEWVEAIASGLAISVDRLADRQSAQCRWDNGYIKINNTFSRFALPIVWDYCEGSPLSDATGNFISCLEWVAEVVETTSGTGALAPRSHVALQSATIDKMLEPFDLVVTDPPYYDAIPYSDLMDFFYVWLRRTLHGLSREIDAAFTTPLAPKWDHSTQDGELIDDSSRFGGDRAQSKSAYENGMARAFQACHQSLAPDGRLVIVFAHKHPDAWETLVSAIIRAGFIVDGSWPIQTEMGNRTRAQASAALSSSVWLVCKKRPATARPGWDNVVLEGMRRILQGDRDAEGRWTTPSRLHQYWDAGIRGPDFVWAATGPAMEAYSKHPVVRKANEAGAVMSVNEFLRQVRRLVVDFVVGRVLSPEGGEDQAAGLDDLTTYYLLHRHDFGLEPAPIGACILYAVSCNLSDRALVDAHDLLTRAGGAGTTAVEDEDEATGEDDESEAPAASGSEVKLKPWAQRKHKMLGQPVNGRPAPLIDQVHALMHLWKAGDVTKVDGYLGTNSLRQNALFAPLMQALIELSPAGSDERATLESISNHLAGRGTLVAVQGTLIAEE